MRTLNAKEWAQAYQAKKNRIAELVLDANRRGIPIGSLSVTACSSQAEVTKWLEDPVVLEFIQLRGGIHNVFPNYKKAQRGFSVCQTKRLKEFVSM